MSRKNSERPNPQPAASIWTERQKLSGMFWQWADRVVDIFVTGTNQLLIREDDIIIIIIIIIITITTTTTTALKHDRVLTGSSGSGWGTDLCGKSNEHLGSIKCSKISFQGTQWHGIG